MIKLIKFKLTTLVEYEKWFLQKPKHIKGFFEFTKSVLASSDSIFLWCLSVFSFEEHAMKLVGIHNFCVHPASVLFS